MAEIVLFGQWVKRRRQQLDLTQKALAHQAGCALGTIRKIEADERRPSRQLATQLARHLEIGSDQVEAFIAFARAEPHSSDARLHFRALADEEAPVAPGQRPSPPDHPTIRNNLPPQTTPFFGRKQELAQIYANLNDPDCRLLTILAGGGMGKTRLAIEVARAQLPLYSDGLTYVALAPVEAVDASGRLNPLVGALADALGFAFHGGSSPEQQLFAYLQRKELLLVLDNIEHLLAHVVLLSDLLGQAPDVKLLVTSRERLNLQEEWLHALQGLSYPEGAAPAAEVMACDAVQLFAQRARQARASFRIADEYPAVLRICRLVEGMPLGLELAAAWVLRLPCQEIAEEIASEVDFLTSQMRNIPERHRSMRAVFGYSWERLTEKEQDVLMKLSVFRGGFDRAAAVGVTGASLPVLGSLVDRSLLTLAENGRYAIHELVRQFAAEKLARSELAPSRLPQVLYRSVLAGAVLVQQSSSTVPGNKRHCSGCLDLEQFARCVSANGGFRGGQSAS